MLHRIASLVLIFVTVAFFVLHEVQESYELPKFAEVILPEREHKEQIAHNEYLILMEQGTSHKVPKVLAEFGLTLAAPLGEWLHVVRGSALARQEVILWESSLANEDKTMITRLSAHPDIHSAHANFIESKDAKFSSWSFSFRRDKKDNLLTLPRDPFYPAQWYLQKEGGINVPQAWSISTGSADSLIAVVDHHFQFTELDLMPERCTSRKYFYENISDYFWPQKFSERSEFMNHGTEVLSVLAPCTDNNIGLAGIDWHAQVFAVDTLDDRSLSARMFGIMWAAGINICTSSIVPCPIKNNFQLNKHPANIINASFGFAGTYLEEPAYGPVLDVIGLINRQWTTLVASAGNEGDLADRRLPGAAGGVLSVASSDYHKRSSSFSNYGKTVDVLAPGEEIVGLKNNKPVSLNGTSYSSPIVSQIASLMLSVAPMYSWKHNEYILKASASPISCSNYCPDTMPEEQQKACKLYCCQGDKNICAAGIVDASAAIIMASKGIPAVPLIDLDDYYLPLSEHNNMNMKLRVKNWGAAPARVRLKKLDEHLKAFPEEFELAPIKANGYPSTKDILVYYDGIPKSALVLSLVFEAWQPKSPQQISDRIEAIVEIVPDDIIGKKVYRELN